MVKRVDRFEAMAMIIEVVDRKSFSAAAKALRVPMTTLSRKVSDLEALLGAKLLLRTTRKLSLTDAGVAYVAAARGILAQVSAAEREAAGEYAEAKGELTLSAPVQFGRLHVLPVVSDFLAKEPLVDVRLLLLDRNVQLVEEHVDAVLRIGRLDDGALVATDLGSMRTVVCASPTLLACHGPLRTPADLSRLPCVSFSGGAGPIPWQLHDPDTRTARDVAVHARLAVTTAEAAAAAAIQHVGATRLLHYQVADAVRAGALQIVLEAFEPAPLPVNLVHTARAQMPLKQRRFIDFAVPRLRKAIKGIT